MPARANGQAVNGQTDLVAGSFGPSLSTEPVRAQYANLLERQSSFAPGLGSISGGRVLAGGGRRVTSEGCRQPEQCLGRKPGDRMV